ncbi:MAG: CpXC domain-containing protein [Chloroflexota bacterium]
MTKFQRAIVNCPACNTQQEVEVYQTINVTLNPDLKQSLFEGNINILNCSECDNRTPIDTTFLYHDMIQQLAIYYYPPTLIREDEFLKQFNVDGTLNHDTSMFPNEKLDDMAYLMQRPQIVFSMTDLLTYVVFRDRLMSVHYNSDK